MIIAVQTFSTTDYTDSAEGLAHELQRWLSRDGVHSVSHGLTQMGCRYG